MYTHLYLWKTWQRKVDLCSRLHTITGLPLYISICYFFSGTNLIQAPYEQFLAQQREFVVDAWIIHGNSLQSLELRYARAQGVP